MTRSIGTVLMMLMLWACGSQDAHQHEHAPAGIAKGPHGGRLLKQDDFVIELGIFENGVLPEYRAWPTWAGKPVPLDRVQLSVELTRLGGKVDHFVFVPHADYLRGAGVMHEPHSFVVKVRAQHAGVTYEWTYDHFEGRTRIAPEVAASAGIETEMAGPATLVETLPLHGRIAADPSRRRDITARFPGVIRAVQKNVGDRVAAGEALAIIESDESLQNYVVTTPIGGVIAARQANPGEHTADRVLFTIVDPSRVMAELAVFPRDRARIKRGAQVRIRALDSNLITAGTIDRIDIHTETNQALLARVSLDNRHGEWLMGSFVTGEVSVAERTVPVAVKVSALQIFRGRPVVFERSGDQYEARALQLGAQHGDWAEVLDGIEPGAQYVVKNSYLIKADIEKSRATHDH